ncbi:MAG: S-adenosyl-l-methionine hydroxide adenosyltransferase family protein [Candidatus Bathyarchaeota archaeon]|nr:S-adenosyl-l-methionine hydroxide adenosyltransferase family protein [Candidatus Bathyarchaeota archaeon]
MSAKIVTLTTDFGLKDPYVAEMKAAILSVCPTAKIVDVTHEIEKFSIPTGAFMLASAAPYFPKGTVHVAVVDPGVGSSRRPIVMQTESGFFVGPDNGLMVLAAEAAGVKQVREIRSRRFMLPHVSGTFHGRDIFAPVAAHLTNGAPIEEFGPPTSDFVKPSFAQVSKNVDTILGEVLHVDDFGNIITNMHAKDVEAFSGDIIQIELTKSPLSQVTKFSRAYADAKSQEPLALIGSHGYLEIAVNQGSAAATYSAKAGDQVKLSKA